MPYTESLLCAACRHGYVPNDAAGCRLAFAAKCKLSRYNDCRRRHQRLSREMPKRMQAASLWDLIYVLTSTDTDRMFLCAPMAAEIIARSLALSRRPRGRRWPIG